MTLEEFKTKKQQAERDIVQIIDKLMEETQTGIAGANIILEDGYGVKSQVVGCKIYFDFK